MLHFVITHSPFIFLFFSQWHFFHLMLPFTFFFLLLLPPINLTSGNDTLQPDDVGMVKLSQDARLTEKRASLFVRAASP